MAPKARKHGSIRKVSQLCSQLQNVRQTNKGAAASPSHGGEQSDKGQAPGHSAAQAVPQAPGPESDDIRHTAWASPSGAASQENAPRRHEVQGEQDVCASAAHVPHA